MNTFWAWLGVRLSEPTTYLGIAAGAASLGTALASAGFPKAGAIVGCVGAGFGGVGAFIAKESK
jgi:hypothetical protein